MASNACPKETSKEQTERSFSQKMTDFGRVLKWHLFKYLLCYAVVILDIYLKASLMCWWICSQEIVSFNLREEPVVFVGLNHDFVPYSPRDPSSLKGNIANHGVKPEELAETELNIREEVQYAFIN